MGLFTFLHSPNINEGVKLFKNTEGAVLLDVRTAKEYREGHIENSENIPLDRIQTATSLVKDKNTPIFVYCLSGGRSSRAVSVLKSLGYANVTNIGGIGNYEGKAVR